MTDVRDIRLCILGFGHVTQRFCEMVRDREGMLAREHGVRFLVTAVGTGSHGSWLDVDGAHPAEVLAALPRPMASGSAAPERPGVDLIAASGADVLVESTPLRHGRSSSRSHTSTQPSTPAWTSSPSTRARSPGTTAACATAPTPRVGSCATRASRWTAAPSTTSPSSACPETGCSASAAS